MKTTHPGTTTSHFMLRISRCIICNGDMFLYKKERDCMCVCVCVCVLALCGSQTLATDPHVLRAAASAKCAKCWQYLEMVQKPPTQSHTPPPPHPPKLKKHTEQVQWTRHHLQTCPSFVYHQKQVKKEAGHFTLIHAYLFHFQSYSSMLVTFYVIPRVLLLRKVGLFVGPRF
jgi:hypothetical protein